MPSNAELLRHALKLIADAPRGCSVPMLLAHGFGAEFIAALLKSGVAKAEVERAALKLSFTRITAPFDGRVSRIVHTRGSLVVANWTHILTVVATDRLHVSFGVPETTLLRLRRDGLRHYALRLNEFGLRMCISHWHGHCFDQS